MLRLHPTIALVTVLGSTPLLCSAFARAAPAPSVVAPAAGGEQTAPSAAWRGTSPRLEPSAPRTPIPMNLPDDVTADEIRGEYAIGIASLIVATLFAAALVVGALYIVARQTWSSQH